jgi:hypothetical protein
LTFLNQFVMTNQDIQEIKEGWNKLKVILLVFAIIFIVLLLMKGCKAEQQLASNETMNIALKDSLKTWKDKEGNFKANITLLENENSQYFTNWTTADSTVIKLQKLVKEYEAKIKHGGSVTTIGTDANIHIVAPSQTSGFTTVHDTVYANYKSDFNIKGWVWGTVSTTKDSTAVDMRFKEEIDVAIGTEKTGFLGLGKGRPFAEVTLHNPFNTVSTLRAYSTKPAPAKRFGVGPVVAYGVGPGFIPGVFVGIGVNWNIIKL